MDNTPYPCLDSSVSKEKRPNPRRVGGMSVAGLRPEDFRPVSREAFGAGLVRLAKQPKRKK